MVSSASVTFDNQIYRALRKIMGEKPRYEQFSRMVNHYLRIGLDCADNEALPGYTNYTPEPAEGKL